VQQKAIGFDDVCIRPKFTELRSRADVDPSSLLGNLRLPVPIISANMESVTEAKMALAMNEAGAVGALHRFKSIKASVAMYNKSPIWTFVSVGTKVEDRLRAKALYDAGARNFIIDVAHGAQIQVVEQAVFMKENLPEIYLMVGNFATQDTISTFVKKCGKVRPDSFKVGIGPGLACTTKTKTGVGLPQLSAILDCVKSGYPIIADGGCRVPADIVKCLGAGAVAVMVGAMLAATDESPTNIYKGSSIIKDKSGKRTSEGVSIKLEPKGSVVDIIKDIEGGIRSAMTYTDSKDLSEFKNKCEFLLVDTGAVVRK